MLFLEVVVQLVERLFSFHQIVLVLHNRIGFPLGTLEVGSMFESELIRIDPQRLQKQISVRALRLQLDQHVLLPIC